MHETRTSTGIERHIELYSCTPTNWELITTLAPTISVLVGDRPERVIVITQSGVGFNRVVGIVFSIANIDRYLLLFPDTPLVIINRVTGKSELLDNKQRDLFLYEAQLIEGMLKSEYERVDFFSLVSPTEVDFSPLDSSLSDILILRIDISSTLLKRFNIGNLEYALIFNSFSGAFTFISWDHNQQDKEYKVVIYEKDEPTGKKYTLTSTNAIYSTIRGLLS